MTWLRYLPHALAAVLWAGSLWLAFDYGGSEEAAKAADAALYAEREANKALRDEMDARAAADLKAAKAQAEVDRLAKMPPKVIERVRTNPSNCTLPRPVTDGLREQVEETNSAIRAMR